MNECCEPQCENTPVQKVSCPERPCPSQAKDCPIECAAEFWKGSFDQAMRQVQLDMLRSKIQKAWGPMIEKAADAFLESMGAFWQMQMAKIRSAEACHEFKEKLRDIWLEEKKK